MKRILCLILALCALLPFAVFSASAEAVTVTESENENYRLGYRLGYSDAIYDLSESAHRYDRYSSLSGKDNSAYEYGYHYGFTEGKNYVPTGEKGEGRQLAKELEHLTVNGKPFSYDNYPLDTSKSSPVLLGARELGVNAKGEILEDYAIYLYFYLPFGNSSFSLDGKTVRFGAINTVTYGLNKEGTTYTASCVCENSQDGRFCRLYVPLDVSLITSAYNRKNERNIYIRDFSGSVFELKASGTPYPTPITKTWQYGDSFCMVGSFATVDFSATTGDSLTIQADLNYTSWRSDDPNEKAGSIYDQINTVYFKIPRAVYESYDFLYSIRAQFLQLQSSPILVTNSKEFRERSLTDMALYYGYHMYVTGNAPMTVVTHYYDWYYAQEKPKSGPGLVYDIDEFCDFLAYYFYRPDFTYTDEDVFHSAVSSSAFENWITDYTRRYGGSIDVLKAALGQNIGLFTAEMEEVLRLLLKYGDINAELVAGGLIDGMKEYDLDYRFDEVYELEGWKQDTGFSFWKWLTGKKEFTYGSTSISKFEVIESPQKVAAQYVENVAGLADKYYIAEADTGSFYRYLSGTSDVVVLLRFAKTNYECHEFGVNPSISDGKAWLTKTAFFRGVTVSDLTFKKDGDLITYAVNAEPINAYPGLAVKDDQKPLTPGEKWENSKDQTKDFFGGLFKGEDSLWERIKETGKIILIILAVCLLLLVLIKFVIPILAPLFKVIGAVVSAPFKAVRKRKERRETRKNKKE